MRCSELLTFKKEKNMHPIAVMKCLENKTELHPNSDYKEKVYTTVFAILFEKNKKAPAIRGQLTLESDNPLPYHPGKKYSIRLSEDAGLVLADKLPAGGKQ
jgi:hypothetical protein